MGRPQCLRGVQAGATLFNRWKVETRCVRDRLQEIGISCVSIGPGNRRVLVNRLTLGQPAERRGLDQDPGYGCRRGSASTNWYPP